VSDHPRQRLWKTLRCVKRLGDKITTADDRFQAEWLSVELSLVDVLDRSNAAAFPNMPIFVPSSASACNSFLPDDRTLLLSISPHPFYENVTDRLGTRPIMQYPDPSTARYP